MENTDFFVDATFKDDAPTATVDKIINILRHNGIEPVERWGETCVPYCFYLSVNIKGTNFSVNGKGLTKEFARASGYGELMERLQLGLARAPGMQKDGTYSFDTHRFPPVSLDVLLNNHRSIYERLAKQAPVPMTPETLLRQFSNADGEIPCVNCYDLTTGSAIPFPNDIRMKIYGSNGSAAGNTYEEAIVQALSEIVERHNQYITLRQRLTLPDVPEERLAQCPIAYQMIQYIRSQGFRVLIKDCSLGEKFPVICAVLISEKTGRYHAHFGAYPIFEIALERSLTESFQGHNIHSIAEFDDLLCSEREACATATISNEFTRGSWNKSVEFFYGTPKYPYQPHTGFTGGNNRDLLKQCVEYFRQKELHILVYNASTLGFPTCQVLVPGYSELFSDRLCIAQNPFRYFSSANRALRNPIGSSMLDHMGLLMHLDQLQKTGGEMFRNQGFANTANLSVTLTPEEDRQFMNASLACIFYSLGKTDEVLACLPGLIAGYRDQDVSWLIGLKRYLKLQSFGHTEEEISEILEFFHGKTLATELIETIQAGQNPFERFVLHCTLDNCSEECALFSKCCNRNLQKLCQMISQRQKGLNFSAFCDTIQQLLT